MKLAYTYTFFSGAWLSSRGEKKSLIIGSLSLYILIKIGNFKKKILKYVALQKANYVCPVSTGERPFYKEEKKKNNPAEMEKLFIQPKRGQI